MSSVFARALGSDFARLHPELQRRFGFGSTDSTACVGTGVMDEIWRGRAFTVPFLRLGATRNILFPERGRRVPFSIQNFAYVDSFGRETVTFVRTFSWPNGVSRRFDATMVYNSSRGRIVDYLGTHQHLAVDLDVRADERGGLHIRSGGQRFCEGPLDLRFPRVLSGTARVHEWYDDAAERFRIEVHVANDLVGPLFGYRGSFTVTYLDATRAAVPAAVRPVRENPRG